MHNRITESGLGILPLRLVVGFGFAAHGYAKLSRGPESFATILLALGVPHARVTAWVTSVLELTGGLFVMAGAFVVPLSLPLAIVMLTALFEVHLRYGFSSIRLKAVTPSGAEFGPVGYEINLLYIAGLATLALFGAGKLSVDQFLKLKADSWGAKLRSRAERHETRVRPGAAAAALAPARSSAEETR